MEALRERGVAEQVTGAISLLAVGKAAEPMARGALAVLGERVERGLIIVPHGTPAVGLDRFEVVSAGHPIPDNGSLLAGEAAGKLARGLGEGDILLLLLSGGASALMTAPRAGISLAELQELTGTMQRGGATISELNAARRGFDRLKGGGLADLVAPARVFGLVLSDVVGDRIADIGSGPLTPDPTSVSEVVTILRRYEAWPRLSAKAKQILKRDNDEKRVSEGMAGVAVEVIGTNATAVQAAARDADRRGYRTSVLTCTLQGEARHVGRRLAALGRAVQIATGRARAPVCLIAGGETTVTVRGDGSGGRNQELALAAALELDGLARVSVVSCATDGVDGPTAAAGAYVDGATVARGAALGMAAEGYLERNDSNTFFSRLGDLIITGPTGTNVMDVILVLVE